jgi:hypothetical protein
MKIKNKKQVLASKVLKTGTTAMASLLTIVSLSACVLNGNKKVTSLTMSGLNYDETSKKINWDKVYGATSYEVFIDGIDEEYIDKLLVVKEPVVDFTEEPTGEYNVEVKAKNSKTKSKEKTIEISHIKAEKLATNDPKIDQKGHLLYWTPVENAIGYVLSIKGAGEDIEETINLEDYYNPETKRYEYPLTNREAEKAFKVELIALGDKINFTDSIKAEREYILHSEDLIKTLEMSEVTYADSKLFWEPVKDATGYAIEIIKNGQVIEKDLVYTYNQTSGLFECNLDAVAPGICSAKIIAKGNESGLVVDSNPVITEEFDKPVSYTNFISRLEEKLTPLVKYRAMDGDVKDVRVFGVTEDGSEAFVSFYSPLAERMGINGKGQGQYSMLNLGEFENFASWYDNLGELTKYNLEVSFGMEVSEDMLHQFVETAITTGIVEGFTENEISIENIKEIHLNQFKSRQTSGFIVLDNNEVWEMNFYVDGPSTRKDKERIEAFFDDNSLLSRYKEDSYIIKKHNIISPTSQRQKGINNQNHSKQIEL